MIISVNEYMSNWIAGSSGIVTFGLMYFLRVPREEEMMLEEFGEQYRQYISKTGRVIPILQMRSRP